MLYKCIHHKFKVYIIITINIHRTYFVNVDYCRMSGLFIIILHDIFDDLTIIVFDNVNIYK